MRDEGIDAVVTSTVENNYYFSGVWVRGQVTQRFDTEFYTVATAAAPDSGSIVCSIGHADLALGAYPNVTTIHTFGTFYRDIIEPVVLNDVEQRVLAMTRAHTSGRSSLEALSEAIVAMQLTRSVVAVDERGPRTEIVAQLVDRFPAAEFRPAAALLRKIRAVKTAEEQQLVIDALRLNESGLRAALECLRVGVTEREVKAQFDVAVTKGGGQPGFCLVKFGRAMALGQIPPGDAQLSAGDFMFFDIGVDKRSYKSDIGRLVSFGEPSPQLQSLFAASKAGQQAAIDMMRPGVVAADVFGAAVEAVREAGVPTYERQHVGHAIGLEYYDMPVLTPTTDTALEAGMTFEVETPYYRLGVGGAFIEDTVLVTDTGTRILTELDREILIVEPI